jgi:N-acetylglucosaminyldiphosphoundecaprenol N-acetyl-beta-D-mannosaminyltransferase
MTTANTIKLAAETPGDAAATPVAVAPLSIMGVGVMPFESYEQAVSHVEGMIEAGRKCFCVAVNPEKVYRAMHDPRVMESLVQANIGICDGIGVVWASRLLHHRSMKRCTGCDLFFHLVARAAERGWKVFLLGASAESNAQAAASLAERCHGLQVVGRQDGYFKDSGEVIAKINDSGAQMLFVAMGSPRQELWVTEHRDAIQAPFCMGVGGTFDVASGMAKRAPRIFRKTGTEFLFQLVTRPGWSTKVRLERTLARFRFLLAVARMAWFGPKEKLVADTQ